MHPNSDSPQRSAIVTYFSSWKNTRDISHFIADCLTQRDWLVTIKPLQFFPKNKKPDLIVVGTPVQYWTVPDAVLQWINHLPDLSDTCGFVFSTYGGCLSKNVPYLLGKALNEKGVRILGGAQILSPHSCVSGNERLGDQLAEFGMGQPSTDEFQKLLTTISKITAQIESGHTKALALDRLKISTMGMMANVMNQLIPVKMRRKLMPEISVSNQDCDSCQKCIKICASKGLFLNNRSRINYQPKNCTKCYACIETCKTSSITTDWIKVEKLVRSTNNKVKNRISHFIT